VGGGYIVRSGIESEGPWEEEKGASLIDNANMPPRVPDNNAQNRIPAMH
jgi:hypothetical protein